MNPKWTVWLTGILVAAVIAAGLYFPALRRQVNKAKDLTEKTAEQARRELLPVAPVNSGDPMVKVQMFWGSRGQEGAFKPGDRGTAAFAGAGFTGEAGFEHPVGWPGERGRSHSAA